MTKKYNPFVVSLIAVVLGIALGFVVVAISGKDPLDMAYAIIRTMTGFNLEKLDNGPNFSNVFNWFLNSMPIILTGLSVGFAFRTGLFNIGAEGQYLVGSFAASAVALLVELPPVIHPIMCILAGALAGALWGLVPGILKAIRGINEVVICIMMNYTALHFVNLMTKTFLPIDQNTLSSTIKFPESAMLGPITDTTSRFNIGFLVVLLCVFLYWLIIEKTTFGYSLRATGFNSEASRFAGMKVNKNVVYSMMISGALAGIAGAIVICGTYYNGRIYTNFDNFGFTGISVALVGAANALGIALAGLLLGLISSSGNILQLYNIPKEIYQLIEASIILFVAIQYGIVLVLNKVLKKKEKQTKQEVS